MSVHILAVDTETTGLDAYHGNSPFIVTFASNQEDQQDIWSWRVNPLTREVKVPKLEAKEVIRKIEKADILVFQNAKFDIRMIDNLPVKCNWDWSKIHDISISAHLLGSAQNKDLTTQALRWINTNLDPYEKAVKEATDKARRICRTKLFKEEKGEWDIAKDDHPKLPSGGGWKADMWLLEEIAIRAPEFLPEWRDPSTFQVWDPKRDDPKDHPWFSIAEYYALPDSDATLLIFQEHQRRLESLGLLKIYEKRRELLRLVSKIESTGVIVNRFRRDELVDAYVPEVEKCIKRCIGLSEGRLDKVPIQGVSNALRDTVFDHFGLESPKKTPTGNPSLDKEVLDHFLLELRPNSAAHVFIKSLKDFRKRMTAINYMKGYEKFWLPYDEENGDFILHPSLNMTGTTTLRWSSSNPNEQNISKQEGFNLRYAFGPPKEHFWASIDYENLELRIPAYESGEEELIALFERSNDPPFYGSNHLLNFSTIYPDLWDPLLEKYGPENVASEVKKRYKSTWYQRCKNGGFAIQYGSVITENKVSTADKAFGRIGAHQTLKDKFAQLDKLNQSCIEMAQKTGFVHTIPDKEVDPEKGYPLECKRTRWGKVKPTIPLNYHVQGTACWVIMIAMLMVDDYLKTINRKRKGKSQFAIVMQIHDELVIQGPLIDGYEDILKEVSKIMSSVGSRIGIPLRVGCDVHLNNWASGKELSI